MSKFVQILGWRSKFVQNCSFLMSKVWFEGRNLVFSSKFVNILVFKGQNWGLTSKFVTFLAFYVNILV